MSSDQVQKSEQLDVNVTEPPSMGLGASKPAKRGIVLSFDALRTLYRFRAPVAEQYLTIAKRCGLKSQVKLSDLEVSFRRSYKAVNSEFPNYGKGKLDNPQVWWTELVKRSFKDVVKDEDLPEDLGSTMYQHFSSGAAYELYPDVKPFLQAMRQIRKDPNNPTLILGIITNSDPRVKDILESMDIRVGKSTTAKPIGRNSFQEDLKEIKAELERTGNFRMSLPWAKLWDPSSDFDFMTTSYQAGSEKPDDFIFAWALEQARDVALSIATQREPRDVSSPFRMMSEVVKHSKDVERLTWIHVGDEYEKDYLGAKNSLTDAEALLLVREGEGKPVEGANIVTSLTEVASIVNLMI